MPLPQEIIRRKRDGGVLSTAEIADFAAGLASGAWSEGQIAALGMAIFIKGISREEIVGLTLSMRDSGEVLDWSSLPGPVTDKHSTGGVGDNVSLILAPIVAACGAYVPMISGRGLGHTGGTLDKMDSIPGYETKPTRKAFARSVREAGCAIIGQTGDLAPADGRFYAVRDVTGTVESIPLITASILSKKLAAGLQSLVLDVKCGNGAFMVGAHEARKLAESLVSVAEGAGLSASALITDMNEPLASCAGNAIEVLNAVDFLTGKARDKRLEKVITALAAEMLLSAGIAQSMREAYDRTREALDSGRAAERFGKMVHALSGPADFVENARGYLPSAPAQAVVKADRDGFIARIDTRGLGIAVIELGGGRRRAEDAIDHAVGLDGILPVGAAVRSGEPLLTVHARMPAKAEQAAHTLRTAFEITEDRPRRRPPILRKVALGG